MKTYKVTNKSIIKNLKSHLIGDEKELIKILIKEKELLEEKNSLLNQIINNKEDIEQREDFEKGINIKTHSKLLKKVFKKLRKEKK